MVNVGWERKERDVLVKMGEDGVNGGDRLM